MNIQSFSLSTWSGLFNTPKEELSQPNFNLTNEEKAGVIADFSNCNDLNPDQFGLFLENKLNTSLFDRNIEKLDLYKCKINSKTLANLILARPEIKTLNLSKCHEFTFIEVNDHLSKRKNLHTRVLSSFWRSNVQHLNLEENIRISDKDLKIIAKHFPMLTKLNLSNCEAITDIGINHIVKNCKSLIRIELDSCYSLGEKSIIALAEHPSLTQIVLPGCIVHYDPEYSWPKQILTEQGIPKFITLFEKSICLEQKVHNAKDIFDSTKTFEDIK